MSGVPAVSVLMPVRDGERYIAEALHSIAAQTLDAHEVVVVDDGSTDATASIVAGLAAQDPRIRLLRRPAEGIVHALNAGLEACNSEFVARLDADDLMRPQRLAQQLQAFSRSPSAAVVGSAVRLFPEHRVGTGMREYVRWQHDLRTPARIAANVFWEAPFVHPSVMFRRSQVRDAGGYRDGPFPEDYELWLRLHAGGAVLHRLSAVLTEWRQHEASLSRNDRRYARTAFDTVRTAYLARHLQRLGVTEVTIWGAGRRTRKRVNALLDHGLSVHGWVDIDPAKLGQRHCDALVHPPSWLRSQRGRTVVLGYVTAHGAREQIAAAVRAMGYSEGVDFWSVG